MHIKDRIEEAPMSRRQVAIIAICTALYMIDGFDVLVMAFSASHVEEEWGLNGAQLGYLLSAALVGMAVGSIFVSTVADIFGRQRTMLVGVCIVGLGMLASFFAPNYAVLLVLRLLTGLAIGTLQATIGVFASEFSNAKRRSTALSIVTIGQPIGGVLGGLASGVLISQYGWRSAFLLGAVATFLMIPLVMKVFPESVDFLLARRPADALAQLNRSLRSIGQPPVDALPDAVPVRRKTSRFADVLTGYNTRRTILLSLAYFILMASFYFANSWTPKLITASGFTARDGINAGVLFSVGAIAGGITLGLFGARFPMRKVLAVFFVAGAATFVVFANSTTGSVGWALFAAALVGFGSNAPIAGMLAISPTYYTSEVRGTALGLVIGMGRLGAIISPILAGALIDGGWSAGDLYFLFVLPMALGAVVISRLGKPVLHGPVEKHPAPVR
ncbi:MFS transporter [Arthrobacter sp. zg-Y40]|uniref:MFS transporter n=1 Tax=unclassified Arthrobacter TaxID=235627 RepID=UPI001D154C43|nr:MULTISPECIES: MFS transporter [unclassified Arthrobacter]MCC3275468.1 MFS transporter [Arthrobacter sp. zg-Y20]MCC3278538.1 MFS transporter [Arthrobacter sp. zg-Y40]MDK1315625.1 MFS transporter [Arthrobacter sp. zg.Y20]WIB06039.1 MFS transporter [Arthrobacter sp. zg-Y20]